MPVLISIKDASEYAGVPEATLRNAVKAGQMKAFITYHASKECYKLTHAEIDRWIESELTYVSKEAIDDMEKARNKRENTVVPNDKRYKGVRLIPGTRRLELVEAEETND
jgi:hypothetical protein